MPPERLREPPSLSVASLAGAGATARALVPDAGEKPVDSDAGRVMHLGVND